MPIPNALAGIKNLSQLTIDAIKNWAGMRIDNVGAPNTDDDVPRARAADILSGRFGKTRLEWTAAKLLRGAGAGVDPTEIDVPAGGDFPMKLKPALVRWVIPGWYSGGVANSSSLSGFIWYIPIFVEETTTYIRMGINIITALVGTADLRIFSWANGLPGSLILSAGTIDTGTTGLKEIIISQQLTRGYYFLAIRTTANATLQGLLDTATTPPVSGYAESNAYPACTVLGVSGAYADPALAPTDSSTCARACVRLREN